MFQFPGLAPLRVTGLAASRVAPFGHPEITAYVQLPQAYRSLSRPSSPLDAKASTVRLIAFDLDLLQNATACYSVLIPQHLCASRIPKNTSRPIRTYDCQRAKS